MANTNNALGFQFRGNIHGSPQNPYLQLAYIPSSDGTALYVGDLVKATNTTDSTAGVPIVSQAGTTDAPYGVVMGFDPVRGVTPGSENLTRQYRPASTAMYAWVCTDPSAVYEIQSDGTVASSDMGKYAHITSSPTGSTSYGTSGMQLNEASISGTKSSLQMYIIDSLHSPDNAYTAANTKLLVRLVNMANGN